MPTTGSRHRRMDFQAQIDLRVGPGRRQRRIISSRKGRAGHTDSQRAWIQALRKFRGSRGPQLQDLAVLFASLGSPHRLKILFRLAEQPAGYRALQDATGLQAGPLYHHIETLRAAGLLAPKQRDVYRVTEAGLFLTMLSSTIPELAKHRKAWEIPA